MSTPPPRDRRAGILLHPTSLPGPHGVGDLGDGALRFADWLAEAGVTVWQVLPLVPPGGGNSPYSSWSVMSISPWLLSLDRLVLDGLLAPEDAADRLPEGGRVDFGAMIAFKAPRLSRAADALRGGTKHPLQADFRAFVEAERGWLDDAALFSALRDAHAHKAWWEWPAELRDREPEALASAREALAEPIERFCALQFLVDRQWRQLRIACNARGVLLLGDLPIYVDAQSADVWANRQFFSLDERGERTEVSGVPPDGFSDTGQLWGNPLYRWDVLAADGYRWWVARLSRALAQTDRVRIDHFRAFSAYWAVPAAAPDARGGRWVPGPGVSFFRAMETALGSPLPIVAEDLGVLDDGVISLLRDSGLPGMRVLQFAYGGGADNFYLPHNHTANSVAYTGTHDNNTTLGWWHAADEHVRDHVRRYFGISGSDVVWDLIRAALASVADLAVVPMQDVLALGAEDRMNTPAQAEGNWGWRLRESALASDIAARFRGLVELYLR